MNCMAVDVPCAPIGHILDMFSPRSMSTTGGRPVRCKFTGVYSASSSTPRLTAWSHNSSTDFRVGLPNIPPSCAKTDLTGCEESPQTDPPCSEQSLDSDSGNSSDFEDSASADGVCVMPLASETFETVLLELKEEEDAARRAQEAENALSDCSDDSYDFSIHSIYSESPTLDRPATRVKDSECSQICCTRDKGDSITPNDSEPQGSDLPATPRRVRFADHIYSLSRLKASKNSQRPKASADVKPILKLSSDSQ